MKKKQIKQIKKIKPVALNRKKDPHHAREAKLYEHPVPSREFIMQYLEKLGQSVQMKHLLQAFNIHSPEEKEGLRRRLIAMERDGQLMQNRRGAYVLVKDMELIRGRVLVHRDGFGFVIPDDGSSDIFLPAREVHGVFNNDVVLVRISYQREKGREGRIVEVLERNTHQIVGRYFEEQGVAFVTPHSKAIVQDILVPKTAASDLRAKSGQFVVVEITDQPTQRRQAMGRIIEILGDPTTAGIAVELATRTYQLPHQWSPEILKEAERLGSEVTGADKANRRDLTALPFVTIDGEDAKDFDDAVYCNALGKKGFELYVAIADVSHYVKPNSALDQDAKERGNSVYFPMRVIPMLPEVLSNHLCSLKPNTDRLVVVCKMHFDLQGELQKYEFFDAVIHSHARLTYTAVAAFLEGKDNSREPYFSSIRNLYKLYKQLLEQRVFRGAIEFETIETQIQFDASGKIKKIVPVVRNVAHKIIEECMLAANVAASFALKKANIPTLYRVHEGPEKQKLDELRQFLRAFGLRLTGGEKPTSMDYAKLLSRIEKRPDVHLLQTVILRSLQQAIYTSKSEGHFGLSYEQYCHFTSPIRRYPDLIVHRGIKKVLKNKTAFLYDEEQITQLGEHCSMTERRADRATRDATDWLKCEYMLDKLGKTFDARIVDVTGFGVFVGLDNIYVTGLVHITALKNDYYHYEPMHRLLRGKRSGKVYRLGDPLRVLVARVDLDERRIDFDLAD